mgnify:CR=1 FL=1
MCVSLKISLVAGLIGEICALALRKDERVVASFIAVYSLMQFYEAYSYYKGRTPRFPIQTLLALQGVSYFVPAYLHDKSPLSLSCLVISICILLCVSLMKEPYATNCENGCRWEIGLGTRISMIVMYSLIILYGLTKPHLRPFSIFCILSILIVQMRFLRGLQLSWWCFVAAILAPLYVAYRRMHPGMNAS